MTISLDALSSAVDRSNGSLRAANSSSLLAPHSSHDDLLLCPVCGQAAIDGTTISKIFFAVKHLRHLAPPSSFLLADPSLPPHMKVA